MQEQLARESAESLTTEIAEITSLAPKDYSMCSVSFVVKSDRFCL
jgi:hypothetical protein